MNTVIRVTVAYRLNKYSNEPAEREEQVAQFDFGTQFDPEKSEIESAMNQRFGLRPDEWREVKRRRSNYGAPCHPAYDLLAEKAKEIGWPDAYRADLTVIDRAWLNGEFTKDAGPVADFLWVLRDSGTHVVDPSADAERFENRPAAMLDSIIRHFSPARFFRYLKDENRLEEVTLEQAREWVQYYKQDRELACA
jgi:hypothetical protein